jgi:osmoprotectant transport system substrate-binding protein
VTPPLLTLTSAALTIVALAGCGGSTGQVAAAPPPTASTQTTTTTLPGAGKPPVMIGDKNYTEQFVLGELYYEALQAQGFPVQINQNIGPTQVIMQALANGQLGMYPEYLETWNSQIAGYSRQFKTRRGAFVAADRYARSKGLNLLEATPFSDTAAIGVTVNYAQQNHLRTIADLREIEQNVTLGGPPQFQQTSTGLPALEQVYRLTPAAFKALEIGAQYKALDQNAVQAADVNTTDGELTTGDYTLLGDPKRVFGWGNVVPVVSARVLAEEGPEFAATINRVSALLTLPTIRELNAGVDLAGLDPATVARRFLVDHGVIPSSGVS